MKASLRTTKVGFAVASYWLLSVTSANALPPLSRERDGVVRAVDRTAATLTVEFQHHPERRDFRWTRQTEFVRYWQFTNADMVHVGDPVRVRYHAPFFGNAFVCKVILLERGCEQHSRSPLKPKPSASKRPS